MSNNTNETEQGFFSDIVATSVYVLLSTCWEVIKSAALFIKDIITFFINKNKVNKVVGDSLKNLQFKPTKNLSIKKIISKLSLGTVKDFSKTFDQEEIEKGMEYYSKRKVGEVIYNASTYSSTVTSNKKYSAHIEFDHNGKITKASCNCKVDEQKDKYCKHIFALLLKIKCDGNSEKLWQALVFHMECTSELILNIVENMDYLNLSSNNKLNLIKKCNEVEELLHLYNEELKVIPNEYSLAAMLQELSCATYELKQQLSTCIMSRSSKHEREDNQEYEKKSQVKAKIRKPKKRLEAPSEVNIDIN